MMMALKEVFLKLWPIFKTNHGVTSHTTLIFMTGTFFNQK